MSKGPLPEYVDATRLFTTGTVISATVSTDRLKRFSEYLVADDGDRKPQQADVKLEFDVDASGSRVISGVITISVTLECQRCLGPVAFDLEVHPELVAVNTDNEARELRSDFETVVLRNQDGTLVLDVLNLVEDELILGLPLAPSHSDEDCSSSFEALKSEAGPNTGKRSLTGDDPEVTRQLLALKAKLGGNTQDGE